MTIATRDPGSGQNLANALEEYSDVYLKCRGIQHRWNVTMDMHITESLDGGELVERHLDCENCEALRKDRFLLRMDRWQVRRLEVLGAVYKYPEGYLLSEMGHAPHPREILRMEIMTRSLGGKAKMQRELRKKR